MKNLRLHHVGIVMNDMERVRNFMTLFKLEEDYCEYVEAYEADCLFTKFGEFESPIEFVIPRKGVLLDYNKGKGGLHHIAIEVDDVEAARAEFESKGRQMLEQASVPGAGGIIVNFLRPRFGYGILVEFVERLNKEIKPNKIGEEMSAKP